MLRKLSQFFAPNIKNKDKCKTTTSVSLGKSQYVRRKEKEEEDGSKIYLSKLYAPFQRVFVHLVQPACMVAVEKEEEGTT